MRTVAFAMSRLPKNRQLQRGSAFIEFVLLFPILFFMFLGAFDGGFVCYALVATQSAARVAALYTSSSAATQVDQPTACAYVQAELKQMPNASQFPLTCNASPLKVTAALTSGPDSKAASTVTVSYSTVQLLPLPWLSGQLTITRTAEMRVRT